ncbi:MAG: aspartyl/asparaginyl beta-hydroxylase domain-containing protein [Planctomycetes bacterium]|nr:aspartyl/asparaginyl beta-hydroxylase domain-containing protein [Planctomycetota bacterium]
MFVDRDAFDFVPRVEARWIEIRDEALALPDDLVEPWVEPHLYGIGWNLAGLQFLGREIAPICARCPKSAAVLRTIPGLAMATFSRLAPGAHIATHTGWGDRVFRFHLALVVPGDCALRVGDEIRMWSEGICFGFDDTVPHEAWNRSERERWVLMFDVIRPGLHGPAYDIAKLPTDLLRRLGNWFPDVDPALGKPRKEVASE